MSVNWPLVYERGWMSQPGEDEDVVTYKRVTIIQINETITQDEFEAEYVNPEKAAEEDMIAIERDPSSLIEMIIDSEFEATVTITRNGE